MWLWADLTLRRAESGRKAWTRRVMGSGVLEDERGFGGENANRVGRWREERRSEGIHLFT
jgi:hypothetical protein